MTARLNIHAMRENEWDCYYQRLTVNAIRQGFAHDYEPTWERFPEVRIAERRAEMYSALLQQEEENLDDMRSELLRRARNRRNRL